ncbi:MAG: oligosaccharide flippase family protein [Clostridia bacterium]|nr:oligosaccharide flippase family protein [Clostridia bacterium]
MRNEIKWGAVLGYVSVFVQLFITLFYVPAVIDVIGQSEYGLFSLITSVMAYFSVLDMGFGNALVRFSAKSKVDNDGNEKNINGLFIIFYSIIGVIALVLGIVLLNNIELVFDKSLTSAELVKAGVMMKISIITIAFSFPLSVFQAHMTACEKFITIKILNLIRIILQPITILLFLKHGYDVTTMVLITSLYTFGIQIINMIYCLKFLDMKINFKIKDIDKILVKEILIYSFFIFLNILVDNLYNNTDQVIIGIISGTTAVSVYAIATRISSINLTFSTTISSLFLPRITKLSREENGKKKVSDLFLKVSKTQLYIMVLILAGFIILGETFISWWLGSGYEDAYWIVLLLIGPAIVPLTQNVAITVLQAENKHAFRSIVYITIAILNIIVSIPLVKLYGGIGAAIGTAIATIAGQILTMNWYYAIKIKLDIKHYWKHFCRFAIPVLGFAIILKNLCEYYKFAPFIILAFTCVFTIIYCLYCWCFMDKEEKEYIQLKIKSLIKH